MIPGAEAQVVQRNLRGAARHQQCHQPKHNPATVGANQLTQRLQQEQPAAGERQQAAEMQTAVGVAAADSRGVHPHQRLKRHQQPIHNLHLLPIGVRHRQLHLQPADGDSPQLRHNQRHKHKAIGLLLVEIRPAVGAQEPHHKPSPQMPVGEHQKKSPAGILNLGKISPNRKTKIVAIGPSKPSKWKPAPGIIMERKPIHRLQPIRQSQQRLRLQTRWRRIVMTNQFKSELARQNQWQQQLKVQGLTVIGMCQFQKN